MEENNKKIKVAWLHNYDTKKNLSSGVFMYQLYNTLKGTDEKIHVNLINIGNINNPVVLIIKFFKYRNMFKAYDILHAQYGSGTGFFTSLFFNNKIVSLRGSDWYYTPSRNLKEIIHAWLGCKLTRLSLFRFKTVIVMSLKMKDEITKQNRGLNVEVIPDGINLNRFYPIFRKPNDVFRVLFSSIRKTNTGKRFELAQKAFDVFNKKYPKSELIFMQGIPHDEVNDFINSIDVILLTSTHEGWPNIIKEGLACNIPFVSTDVSDLKQIANLTESCTICSDTPESLALGLEAVYTRKTKEDIRRFIEPMDIIQISSRLIYLYKTYETN